MEYGLIPKIDQYSDNKAVQIEQVHASTETTKTSERNQLREVQREEFINAGKTQEVEKTSDAISTSKYEYTLTNTNFGFNNNSSDFFVRVARGNAENQFPTESMMRLKSYLMNLDSAS